MQRTILIVDDEEPILKLLEVILLKEGYTLLQAKSGGECLDILARKEVNLVLLDVMLPGISGYDVLKGIRENEKTKTLPVILLTALKDKESKIKGLKQGADDFISKPFDRAELLARINTQIQLSFLRNQLAEKEKFLAVIDKFEGGIITAQNDFKPIIINQRAKDLLEIEKVPENIFSFLQNKFPSQIENCEQISDFILKREETKESKPFYISINVQTIKNFRNEIDSYIFFLQDVTKQHLKNQLSDDFLSLISKRLSTPLSAIKAIINHLDMKVDDAKLKIFTNNLKIESSKLEKMFSRLLYFLELKEKGTNTKIEKTHIDGFLSNLEEMYSIENKVEITKNINVDKINYWRYIILKELVENSFKFCNLEKLVVQVELTPTSLIVQDNGAGIHTEEREKIFGPFQGDKYITDNIPGTGLGLPIVKKLVELEEGKINIENIKPSGFKISISFKEG